VLLLHVAVMATDPSHFTFHHDSHRCRSAAPDGLPGSHPDDFVGPGQADGWHDLGPPPGRNVPGRGGTGTDPFGGFM